ncbi:MAG: sulfite exporter TauE/SafE family protein [Deltaproteobacteria bacterium]|nr:sulfite exporter TauE/SafE family protein [Deltaproteobacteria bacterium]
MDATLIALGFTTGLVTSLHCVGMCGPLVLAVGFAGGAPTLGSTLLRTSAWNLGRGVALVAVGAGIGAAGAVVPAGRAAAIATLAAGILTVLVALALPGWLPLPRALRARAASWGGRLSERLARSRGVFGALAVGAATAALPCGPLYGVWAQAAAVGAWGGAVLLGTFWLGTVPALTALALGSGALRPWLRRWAIPVAAATLGIAGGALIYRGIKFLLLVEPAARHLSCH